jgi:hypothetical protein
MREAAYQTQPCIRFCLPWPFAAHVVSFFPFSPHFSAETGHLFRETIAITICWSRDWAARAKAAKDDESAQEEGPKTICLKSLH